MSEKVSEQEVAKFEEWPLSKNWWLHIQSERGTGHFAAFDFIKISAQGPDNYSRPITSVMVPKIDGFVCESHSFISYLINQNLEAVRAERDRLAEINKVLSEALERSQKILQAYSDVKVELPDSSPNEEYLAFKGYRMNKEVLEKYGVKEMGK